MAFTGSCEIEIQSGQVTGTLTDFPVVISVTNNDLRTVGNGGYVEDSNGYDIRPFSNSGLSSSLAYRLVSYDGAAGTLVMIAKRTIATGTKYYLGFGDASLNTDGSSTAAFNSNYAAVWLMNGSLSVADSAQYGLNGTNNGVTAATGNIDGCGEFKRADGDYVTVGDDAHLDFGSGDFTVSCWVKLKSTGIFGGMISKLDGSDVTGWKLVINSDNTMTFACNSGGTFGAQAATSSGTYTSTTDWYHVVGKHSGGGATTSLYVNTSLEATVTTFGLDVSNSEQLAMGLYRSGDTANHRMNAFMRDFRLLTADASTAWIGAEYNCTNDPASFATYTFGAPSSGGKGAGYYYSQRSF